MAEPAGTAPGGVLRGAQGGQGRGFPPHGEGGGSGGGGEAGGGGPRGRVGQAESLPLGRVRTGLLQLVMLLFCLLWLLVYCALAPGGGGSRSSRFLRQTRAAARVECPQQFVAGAPLERFHTRSLTLHPSLPVPPPPSRLTPTLRYPCFSRVAHYLPPYLTFSSLLAVVLCLGW